MLPLPNSKTNKNTGQNCSTYSFTITKYVPYDKGMFVGRVLIVGLALRILAYFFRIGSQVRLTPSFLKIFWSTSLSMTVQ